MKKKFTERDESDVCAECGNRMCPACGCPVKSGSAEESVGGISTDTTPGAPLTSMRERVENARAARAVLEEHVARFRESGKPLAMGPVIAYREMHDLIEDLARELAALESA